MDSICLAFLNWKKVGLISLPVLFGGLFKKCILNVNHGVQLLAELQKTSVLDHFT